MKKFTVFRQMDSMDCGPTCLRMIAHHYGKRFTTEEIQAGTDYGIDGTSIKGIMQGAESIKISSMPVRLSLADLRDKAPLPCVAHWRQGHYVVVYRVTSKHVYVADPAAGKIRYSHSDFLRGWIPAGQRKEENPEGILILFEPDQDFDDQVEKVSSSKGLAFLLPYLKPYKREWVQLLLGLLVVSIINIIFPFITQAVVDKGIAQMDLNFIWLLLAAQLALFVSRMIADVIRDWLLLHVGARINISLLTDFLKKMMRLPPSFFSARQIGDLMQRVGDHKRIEQFLSAHSLLMVFSIFNLVVFGLILGHFNGFIFICYLIGTLGYIVWVLLFMSRREKIDHMQFAEISTNQSSLVQIIQGIQEIKLNNSAARRRKEWEESQVSYYRVEMKRLALFHYQRTGGTFISQVKNILITFFGAVAVVEGEMSLGTMMSIIYIIGQLNGPIRNFIDFAMGYQNARISLDRMADIYDVENEDEQGGHIRKVEPNKPIVFRNVTFRYPTSREDILKGINLEIEAGKVNAIVGVSGSGKTTLLKLILKMFPVVDGEIMLGETPLFDVNSDLWRQKCGVVMQDGYIFNDTVKRNITESDSTTPFDQARFDNAIRVANLRSFIDSLPYGMETSLNSGGGNISGGQKQRILIARAIYGNPDYIFFDEATSSLDAENERVIMENLDAYFAMSEKTVIVIAHRLSTVKKADNIIVMDQGEVIEKGSHESLIEARGAYFNLVQNQLELGG